MQNQNVDIVISCETGEVRKVTSEAVANPTAVMSQLLPQEKTDGL